MTMTMTAVESLTVATDGGLLRQLRPGRMGLG